jgi:hypothetical protein
MAMVMMMVLSGSLRFFLHKVINNSIISLELNI